MKERLLQEMGALAVDSKWEDIVVEMMTEVVEVQTDSPY